MHNLSFDRKDAADDRDWKQREQSVKALRAFEQRVMKPETTCSNWSMAAPSIRPG
jgi:hypothetical protein